MRALFLAVLLVTPSAVLAQPSPPAGYDVAPLLESLRPDERARVPRQAGVPADALPLYAMTIDLADDLRSFELDETVWWTNRSGRALSSVVFRVYVNAVAPTPLVELLEGSCLDGVSCTTTTPSPSAIVVEPASAIPDGGRLRIRLRLRGRMQEIDPSRTTLLGQGMESLSSISGGHGGDYGLLAHSDGVASMASFFPVLARQRAGLWELSDSSTLGDLGSDALGHVSARVRAADGVRVVAVGDEDPPRVLGDRSETWIRAAFIRDFALVASARFEHADRVVGGVNVRSWFVDGHGAPGARALDAAAHALGIFSRRFGAYPWRQLDVVEAPLVGGAGGVEFSSMVTVATMFYRPAGEAGSQGLLGQLLGGSGGSSMEERRRSMLEFVTAHEVAHQWWHSIVGSDSRQHPFEDEGLAQFSAMLYMRERYGAARARAETEQQVTAGYHMMRLMGRPDVTVDQPVSAFSDPVSYGGAVYGKGPHLYAALRRLLGDAAFFRAIRAHVRAHRFSDAPPRSLLARMARGPRAARVRALERRWLDETHGDEDLGPPDAGRMLGGSSADPQVQALTRELMRSLGSSGGADGSSGDAATLRRLLEALGGAGSAGGLEGLLQGLQGLPSGP